MVAPAASPVTDPRRTRSGNSRSTVPRSSTSHVRHLSHESRATGKEARSWLRQGGSVSCTARGCGALFVCRPIYRIEYGLKRRHPAQELTPAALAAEIERLRRRTALLGAVVGLLIALLRASKVPLDYERLREGDAKRILLRAIERAGKENRAAGRGVCIGDTKSRTLLMQRPRSRMS
jgi:hypothetical protein